MTSARKPDPRPVRPVRPVKPASNRPAPASAQPQNADPRSVLDPVLPEVDINVLRRAIAGVQAARDCFRRTNAQHTRAAEFWTSKEDLLRASVCRGQAMAYEAAADHINEALVEAYDLWKEYDAALARHRTQY